MYVYVCACVGDWGVLGVSMCLCDRGVKNSVYQWGGWLKPAGPMKSNLTTGSTSGSTFLYGGGGGDLKYHLKESPTASYPLRRQLLDNRSRACRHTLLLSLASGVCVWWWEGGNLTSRSWPSPSSQRQSKCLHPTTQATAAQLPLALYHAGAAPPQVLLSNLLELWRLQGGTAHQLLHTKEERSWGS